MKTGKYQPERQYILTRTRWCQALDKGNLTQRVVISLYLSHKGLMIIFLPLSKTNISQNRSIVIARFSSEIQLISFQHLLLWHHFNCVRDIILIVYMTSCHCSTRVYSFYKTVTWGKTENNTFCTGKMADNPVRCGRNRNSTTSDSCFHIYPSQVFWNLKINLWQLHC